MKSSLLVIGSFIGIVILVVCMIFSAQNGAINLEEQVKTAQSAIDVQLNNRFNKLHELAACVKKYDAYEYKTLVDVISQRGKNMSGKEARQCIAAFSRVEERYPELKSQANYQHLMNDISITENHLKQIRDAYNATVKDYNYHCRKFPTNVFLSLTGYRMQKFPRYEVEDYAKDNKKLDLFED